MKAEYLTVISRFKYVIENVKYYLICKQIHLFSLLKYFIQYWIGVL